MLTVVALSPGVPCYKVDRGVNSQLFYISTFDHFTLGMHSHYINCNILGFSLAV
jgi:hypothetical protein